ncbi:MAG: substrate-binding domain-containing protein [Cyclobacteriaceae bacterium]|nr:substrate-binding domain-containing protein [Cyclobacteriaceae bacterium]MBX2916242.1 substrate-binding domain-containing protein [Cyclobacteriaceae bacterium]
MEASGNLIRIKDIAKMAGVSEGTVDRVIHNRGKVSKITKEKVNEILTKINYSPNLVARTLGKSKQHLITTLLPNPQTDPFWKQAYDGILAALRQFQQLGVGLRIENFFYELNNRDSFIEAALKNFHSKPDAVLIAPLFYFPSISLFKNLAAKDIPYVLINSKIPGIEPLAFIGQDLITSGRLAGQLASIGLCKKETLIILHIDEDLQNAIHLKEKEAGFRDFIGNNHRVYSFWLNSKDESKLKTNLAEIIQQHNPVSMLISTSKGFKVAEIIKVFNATIKIICYDLIPANVDCLKKGTIDFIINQNPTRQAKLGTQILANHLLFNRRFNPHYLFPLDIITSENLPSYLFQSTQEYDITV